ncbi:DMP19 family protein [Nocardioides pacificus]
MMTLLRKLFSPRLGHNGSAASSPDVRGVGQHRWETTTSQVHRPGALPGIDAGIDAEDVWSRALDLDAHEQESPRPGDIALASVLRIHGSIMNGGVLNAVEDVFTAEQLDAAEHGYRWFGLDEVADLLARTRVDVASGALSERDLERLERRCDDAYATAVPDDAFLSDLLERRVADEPEAFAPF